MRITNSVASGLYSWTGWKSSTKGLKPLRTMQGRVTFFGFPQDTDLTLVFSRVSIKHANLLQGGSALHCLESGGVAHSVDTCVSESEEESNLRLRSKKWVAMLAIIEDCQVDEGAVWSLLSFKATSGLGQYLENWSEVLVRLGMHQMRLVLMESL